MINKLASSPSKFFFMVVTGFILGIFVGALLDRPWPELLFFILGIGLVVGFWFSSSRATKLILLTLLVFAIGVFRFSSSFFPVDAFLVSDELNRAVRVEGVVSSEVIEKAKAQQVTIDQVQIAERDALGKVLVWVPKYPEVSFGDTLAFQCELERPEPFDGFRYDRYLASRGVLTVCWSPESIDVREGTGGVIGTLMSLKRSLLDKTEQVFAEPHATFLSGLLFGGKGSLSSDLKDDFSETGTAHILAASGYNVSIFSRFLFLALVGLAFRRKTALVLVSAIIAIYVLMSGFDPAVTRAGVMGLIVLFGRGLGRTGSVRNILVLAAALMLMINPRLLLDDVGFQLSFVSTVGLVVLVPKIEQFLQFIPSVGGFREAIGSTIAATTMSLPIIIWQFGTVSTVSILVNLLVLPLVPYAMGFGALAIAVGFISSSFAALIAAPAWACLSVMLWVIRIFGSLGFALVPIPWNELFAILAFMLVGGLIYLLYRSSREVISEQSARQPVLASASVSTLVIISMLFGQFGSAGTQLNLDRNLRVWFLDVGQGDSIFIETPAGEQILIDGGPGEAVLSKLGALMPWWDRSIDTIILTHPHSDHVSGLIEVLDRYRVDRIVTTGMGYHTGYADAFAERSILEGSEIVYAMAPLELGDEEVSLEIVYPTKSLVDSWSDELNETSIAVLISYQDTELLFTGDLYMEQENTIAGLLEVDIEILKVAHHGSKSSTSAVLLDELLPDVAVIPVGKNSYGHPSPVTLRRLFERGITVYRNDLDGDVLFRHDGEHWTIESRPLIF